MNEPVRASPSTARLASRSRLREESGASVARTIMQEPSPALRPFSRASWNANLPSASPTRTPSTVSTPPIVRLHERADGVARERRGKLARGRPDAALPAERDGPGSRADAAFLDGAAVGRRDRGEDVGGRDAHRANVVQVPSVVRLAHHGVDGTDRLVARLTERPPHDRVDRGADREGVGQHDRRLEVAELRDLEESGRLAEPVADVDGGRKLLLKEVVAGREDRRHAGANRVALDEGLVADAHALDVGDRVPAAGRKNPGRDAEVADPRPVLGPQGRRREQEQSGRDPHREDESAGLFRQAVLLVSDQRAGLTGRRGRCFAETDLTTV